MKGPNIAAILLIFLSSCSNNDFLKAGKEFFNKSSFEPVVIQSLPIYDSLKNIVLRNIDTIFEFRDNKNFITYIGENDTALSKQENSDSYSFRSNPSYPEQVRLDNIPAFIYPSIEKHFNQPGGSKITGFTLWKDSTVEIQVKDVYRPEINLDGSHTLIWKRNYTNDPSSLIRDTVIAPGWTYQIWVGEHEAQ